MDTASIVALASEAASIENKLSATITRLSEAAKDHASIDTVKGLNEELSGLRDALSTVGSSVIKPEVLMSSQMLAGHANMWDILKSSISSSDAILEDLQLLVGDVATGMSSSREVEELTYRAHLLRLNTVTTLRLLTFASLSASSSASTDLVAPQLKRLQSLLLEVNESAQHFNETQSTRPPQTLTVLTNSRELLGTANSIVEHYNGATHKSPTLQSQGLAKDDVKADVSKDVPDEASKPQVVDGVSNTNTPQKYLYEGRPPDVDNFAMREDADKEVSEQWTQPDHGKILAADQSYIFANPNEHLVPNSESEVPKMIHYDEADKVPLPPLPPRRTSQVSSEASMPNIPLARQVMTLQEKGYIDNNTVGAVLNTRSLPVLDPYTLANLSRGLYMACQKYDHYSADRLLYLGPCSNFPQHSDYDQTPLMAACRNNDLVLVRQLINCRANIEATTKRLFPLRFRKSDDQWKVVECDGVFRPISFAAAFGHLATLEILLDRGALVDFDVGAWGMTPLQLACYFGHTEIARRLVHAKASLVTYGDTGAPWNNSCWFNSWDTYCNTGARAYLSAPHIAAMQGHVGIVRAMHEQFPNPVDALLAHRAVFTRDPERQNAGRINRATALHAAAASKHNTWAVIQYLTQQVCHIDIADSVGRTVLHYAMMNFPHHGKTQKAIQLLDFGANPNARDNHGFAPLHLLLMYTHDFEIEVQRQLVGILLDRGANPDIQNEAGRTPLQERDRMLKDRYTVFERKMSLSTQNKLTDQVKKMFSERNRMSRWA